VRFRFIPILGFLLLASCSWVLHAETRQQVALLKVERSTPAADRQGLTRKDIDSLADCLIDSMSQ
jgi:hypothetical protein